jgi:diguanylate cyclase (GGDEF)-like protein/putative nucleotidyltransferase with HDIG domain
MLVYGAFLVLIGITATAQAFITSAHVSASVMSATIATDRSIVGAFIESNLTPADLDTSTTTAARYESLEAGLAALLAPSELQGSRVVRVEVRAPDGTVLLANNADRRGVIVLASGGFAAALGGEPSAKLADASTVKPSFGTLDAGQTVIEEYLPIISHKKVMAVVGIVRNAEPLLARIDATRRDVVMLTVVAALIVSLLLFFVFRAAQTRLTRQTLQLIEAASRDALTGLLNHGSVVEGLSDAIDVARAGSGSGSGGVAVALLDVDNFHLLNETYGHAAGDHALQKLATLLDEQAAEPHLLGRFGPDEFLVVAPHGSASNLEALVEQVRLAVGELALQFGTSERLPLTVSVGIATFPEHATAVTDLISTATLALAEAKSSGGDTVRVANRTADERADARGFDVLHGLVITVDGKDHYTRRHSEDVARYATFIARRLGLDEEFQSTIRLAGLLHDVGKIGIPDQILRKPGRLTVDETMVVRQHVALGDAIVRDLPNIEVIRTGILHHHERWDGGGYLHGIGHEEIPLIARILSVADTFSAMTTTRPYRKAMPLTEALKRLGDAAGTQLEEELVKIFIAGIETAPDAPLPGLATPSARLWTPSLQPG